MTEPNEDLKIENKVVVTIDICSSTDILEDLLKTKGIKQWRDLLIWLKEYLIAESKKYNFNLYKFTGDGWIILFDPPYKGAQIIQFLSEVSEKFEEEFKDKIYNILDSPPDITGLTFGIDEGPLVQMNMHEKMEYIGRAINVACRLQGVINDIDIKAGYRAFMSRRLFNSMKEELSGYSPDSTKLPLRNIDGRKPFHFYRLLISKDQFRIIRAIYVTEHNQIDVTKEVTVHRNLDN